MFIVFLSLHLSVTLNNIFMFVFSAFLSLSLFFSFFSLTLEEYQGNKLNKNSRSRSNTPAHFLDDVFAEGTKNVAEESGFKELLSDADIVVETSSLVSYKVDDRL